MNIKIFFRILPWSIVVMLMLLLYVKFPGISALFKTGKDSTIVTHNMIVQRIEAMGKLEVTKYYIKDVVEHKKKVSWGLDRKAVLIISGEVVGCIDLKKLILRA